MAIAMLPRKVFLFVSTPQTPNTNSSNKKQLLKSSSTSVLENASNELQIIHIPSPQPDPQQPQITNGFIRSLCKNPTTASLALKYYHKAREQPKFEPHPQTLSLLVRVLINCKQWSSIAFMIEDFNAVGVFPDKSASAKLVSSCIRSRKFKLAESLLRNLENNKRSPTPAFCSAMYSYNKLHMYQSTVAVYERMKASGILLSPWCYLYSMDAYHKLQNTEMVVALFHDFESERRDIPEVAARICSVLCESLGKSGRVFEALRYFREMVRQGIPPGPSIYASLICSFAAIREAEITEALFQEARDNQMLKDPDTFLKLVVMYVDIGCIEKAIGVVEAMVEMEMKATDCILCIIINGYAKRRRLRDAVRAYEQLLSSGCEPGQVTFASMINVYCRLGLSSKAEEAFSEMTQKGFDQCVVAYSNMISMYGKSGKVKEAMKLLAKMKEKGCKPNVWVYNALLDMHGRLIDLRRVEKLWKEMKRQKIVPDKISYTSIISAYSKAKEFEECLKFYQEFRMNGGKLDRTMAAIMVGILSKSSRTDELINLLRDMKEEGVIPDERLYKSALNALRDAAVNVQVEWFQENFNFEKNATRYRSISQ